MKALELEESIEVIEAEVVNAPAPKSQTALTKSENESAPANDHHPMTEAVAQNFGKILELAGSVIEIKKMKVASEAVLAKMEADRKQLLAEAEVYVEKKNADTKNIVERMNVIRLMMQDFYQQSNNKQITSNDFKEIITSIVDQMSRM